MPTITKNVLPCSLWGGEGQMINYGMQGDEITEEQTQLALQVDRDRVKIVIEYGNVEVLEEMHNQFKVEYPECHFVTV